MRLRNAALLLGVGVLAISIIGYLVVKNPFGTTDTPGGKTPEEAAQNAVKFGKEESVTEFEVLETRPLANTNNTKIVVYRFIYLSGDTPPQSIPIFGMSLVTQKDGLWHLESGGSLARHSDSEQLTSPTSESGQLVEFIPLAATSNDKPIAIIIGRVLSSTVSAVEVTFDDGQILREQITYEGFVIVAPGATMGRVLRVLGANDEILQSISLPPPITSAINRMKI